MVNSIIKTQPRKTPHHLEVGDIFSDLITNTLPDS
jgi:hypothetical protein